MIEKPKQYYDTRRHQLYYQWSESEYFSYQEPIYDRTREYIEELEAENTKLRKFATETWELLTCNEPVFVWKELQELARDLGIEVEE